MLNNSLRVFLIAICLLPIGLTAKQNVDLVDIHKINSRIRVELRYATTRNFTKKRIYSSKRCFVRPCVAQKLSDIQKELEKKDLGLKLWDGFRSLSAQQKLWKACPDKRFVCPPSKNKGRHARGTAVDVTLVDQKGKELQMPTEFDDFSPKAYRCYMRLPAKAIENRTFLENIMKKHGFVPFFNEWWHFDLNGWQNYPVIDTEVPY